MSDKRVYTMKHGKLTIQFEVDARYMPLECLGVGAYGVVCAAKDTRNGHKVAIKKIPRTFDVITCAKRTLRELKILRHFTHDNIISVREVMRPPDDPAAFNDVYLVLDLMETDLHHIIHSNQPLSDHHTCYFVYQILRGLKYIHSANILHRDLKPSNLLVNSDCQLKIGDFGMARGLSATPEEHCGFMTEYVATRWYRAPELMMSYNEYTYSIDVWSVGCILAELLGRRQLFPGKNYLNQLNLILSVVGTPPESFTNNVGSARVKSYLEQLPQRERVKMNVLFPGANKDALDLLDRMLKLNPSSRITVEDALAHPYFASHHDLDDEPESLDKFNFDFEKTLTTKEELKGALIVEVMSYHKDKKPIPTRTDVASLLQKKIRKGGKDRAGGEGGTEKKGSVDQAACSSTKRKPEEGHPEVPKRKKVPPMASYVKEEQGVAKKVPCAVEKPSLLPPPPAVGKGVLPGPAMPEVKQSQDHQCRIVEQQQIINEQHRQLLYFREQQVQMQRAFDQELLRLRNIIDQQGQQIHHLQQTSVPTGSSSHGSENSFSSASSEGTPRLRPALPHYTQIAQSSLVSPAVSDVLSPFPQTPPSVRPKLFFGGSRSPLLKPGMFASPLRSFSYPEGIAASDFLSGDSSSSFPLTSTHFPGPAITQPLPQQPQCFRAQGEEGAEGEGPVHMESRMVSPPKEFELLAHEAFGGYEGFPLPPLDMEKSPPFISVSVSSGSGAGYGVGHNEEVTQEATVSSSKDLCLPCPEMEPPLSASLLKEWGNDIDLKLSSEEMEALQKELELGSADVFRDLNI